MIVQVLLQVGEYPLDLVVGIGHSRAFFRLEGEQIGQIEVYAVHGGAQSFVGVLRLAGLQVGAMAKRLMPFFLPSAVCCLKGESVACL